MEVEKKKESGEGERGEREGREKKKKGGERNWDKGREEGRETGEKGEGKDLWRMGERETK